MLCSSMPFKHPQSERSRSIGNVLFDTCTRVREFEFQCSRMPLYMATSSALDGFVFLTGFSSAARGRTTKNARAVTRCAAPERWCHLRESRVIESLDEETARHPA